MAIKLEYVIKFAKQEIKSFKIGKDTDVLTDFVTLLNVLFVYFKAVLLTL